MKKKFATLSIIFLLLIVSLFYLLKSSLISSPAKVEVLKSSPVGQALSGKTTYTQSGNKQDLQTVKVVRVVDGDTIEIEGGQKVRYIGIDTPETVDPRKTVQCFGGEASSKNRELVEGKDVYLEKDISEIDKYGRLLRYVYLPADLFAKDLSSAEASAKTGVDDIFVNDYLVRQGFAHASSYPPDVKYQDQFTNAQEEARQNNRGLWSSCPQASDQTGQLAPLSAEHSGPNGCLIKGNISSSGEKIYHVPEQRYYDKTVIDGSKGEKWFCTEDEAISVGWRKSKI